MGKYRNKNGEDIQTIMNKKPKLTVGICALNEAENIKNLLNSVLSQKTNNFVLEKIIVISDGSTDSTPKKVTSIKDKRIKLLSYKNRRGLGFRLKQICRLNKSEILVKIDADSILMSDTVLQNLVSKFDKKTNIVGAHVEPLPGKNLLEKIHVLSDKMWHETKKDVKNGNNIHNNHGQITAMKKSFLDKIHYAPTLFSCEDYFYLSNIQLKGKFQFVSNAVVFYKTPDKFYDYLIQARRFIGYKSQFQEYFGDWINDEYFIPKSNLYRAYFKGFAASPILFIGYIFVELIIRLSIKYKKYQFNPTEWEISKSTKTLGLDNTNHDHFSKIINN